MRVRFLAMDATNENIGPFEVQRFTLTSGILFEYEADGKGKRLLLPSPNYLLIVEGKKKATA